MPLFVEAVAPADGDPQALLHPVIFRLMKKLTRRGVLIEEMGQTYLAGPDVDGDKARTLQPLQAAVVTYRRAFGLPVGSFAALSSARATSAVGRVHPVKTGCFKASHLLRLLCGGDFGMASVMSRPFSDTRIAELDARKRSLYLRVNRATTADRLTQTGYTAYRQTGSSGLPLALRSDRGVRPHWCRSTAEP